VSIYQIDTRVVAFTPTGPVTWTDGEEPPPPASTRVIVSLGESNSGGQGDVAELSAPLAASTNRVKILIHASGLFADMDLGTNNNQGHAGLDASYHAWEAGLTTYLDNNPEQLEPMYLVQCGQGGSFLSQWVPGQSAYDTAVARIEQAKAAFVTLGITPVWEIWFTLGINDFISGSPPTPAVYKAACVTLLNAMRTVIGNGTATKIVTPEFMPTIKTPYPTLTAAHEELAVDVVNCHLVDTTGLPQDDDYHWSSAGQVSLGQLMAAA
jgi:hypothetical protein